MSVTDVLARMAQIQDLLAPSARGRDAPASPSSTSFDTALDSVLGEGTPDGSPLLASILSLPLATSALPSATGGTGARALAVAQGEVGQAEEPPGSNDGARIGLYRTAAEGAYAGAPWCAYFVSWCAAQAGAPLGEAGQGYGAVEQIHDWAARTGRLLPASAAPQPGDLILFGGRHIGIVESVNADGSLTTVEGNHRQAVSRVQRSPAEATGYVRL